MKLCCTFLYFVICIQRVDNCSFVFSLDKWCVLKQGTLSRLPWIHYSYIKHSGCSTNMVMNKKKYSYMIHSGYSTNMVMNKKKWVFWHLTVSAKKKQCSQMYQNCKVRVFSIFITFEHDDTLVWMLVHDSKKLGLKQDGHSFEHWYYRDLTCASLQDVDTIIRVDTLWTTALYQGSLEG